MENERIKLVRLKVCLSQKEFGERIGISRDMIANIENDRVEVKPLLMQHLCDVFHVNAEWLRTGVGDMFIESDSGLFDRFADEYSLDDVSRSAVLAFAKLPERDRRVVLDALRSIADACQDATASDLDKADRHITDQLQNER